MQIIKSIRSFFRVPYVIFSCYLAILFIFLIRFWPDIEGLLRYPDILIAPIMSLGSFVAGATFLGGGAVAFPALTKILGTDPQTAKTFSFAIQSVGMSSAAFYILTRISIFPIKFVMLYLAMAAAGLALSLTLFQDVFLSSDIRVGFTLFVLCFLVIYLWTHKNISTHPELKIDLGPFNHQNIELNKKSIAATLLCAFIGGCISGLIGSGADLLAFCLLTLFFRVEIKLATQLSVIIMAILSIVGVLSEIFIHGTLSTEVKNLWIIAAPIVLFGAPLGAIFCRRTTSTSLIVFIVCIVVVEVISTLLLINIAKERYIYYFFCFILAVTFLTFLASFSPHRRKHP